jgi:hypothetical protein
LRGLSCLRGKLARAVLRGGDGGNTVSLLDYDWRDRIVKDVGEGVFYPTRFASPQGTLIPLTPQESLVLYRAKPPRDRAPCIAPAQQLLLFELIPIG